jgi:hypothetical protein
MRIEVGLDNAYDCVEIRVLCTLVQVSSEAWIVNITRFGASAQAHFVLALPEE